MNESKRAADEFRAIRDKLAIIEAARIPRRRGSGTGTDRCGHCPQEPHVLCDLNCKDQAKEQGWYTAETFGE